jgi:hypothetical protein
MFMIRYAVLVVLSGLALASAQGVGRAEDAGPESQQGYEQMVSRAIRYLSTRGQLADRPGEEAPGEPAVPDGGVSL